MSSNDLFSFLDENAEETEDMIVDPLEEISKPSLKKRQYPLPSRSPSPQHSNGDTNQDSEARPSNPKKQRAISPKPVVVDEVEIEAKREVAASAGLMGAVEAGSRLELRHQVSFILSCTFMIALE